MVDVESRAVLKACISARAAVAELKAAGQLIPNQGVLINSIPWADNAIDSLFDELRAKRLLGALVLGFSPILLKAGQSHQL